MERTHSDYFLCTRVNGSTFVIHERDKFEEHPFIYVKLYNDAPYIVLSDTGCGGGSQKHAYSRNLREFIETCPITANEGRPLNSRTEDKGILKKYVIICTHCHYDHILGLEHFQDASPQIVASWEGKSFVEKDLPEHSLCKSLDAPTPQYTVTHWARDNSWLFVDGTPLHLQIIHTPGHTPDELAWYDRQERHLYVGDSFCERVANDRSYEQAILFPKEGNILKYIDSLKRLLEFVEAKNTDPKADRGTVKISCGHVTSSVEAKEILLAVQSLVVDILSNKVLIVKSEEKRDEEYVTWRGSEEPRFSVEAPKRIMLDALQQSQA
ncbi:hypothetical protein ACLMJK_003949 [Lecanora helva]